MALEGTTLVCHVTVASLLKPMVRGVSFSKRMVDEEGIRLVSP